MVIEIPPRSQQLPQDSLNSPEVRPTSRFNFTAPLELLSLPLLYCSFLTILRVDLHGSPVVQLGELLNKILETMSISSSLDTDYLVRIP